MPREGRVPEAAAAVERTGMGGDCSCIIFTPDIHVGRIHSGPALKDLRNYSPPETVIPAKAGIQKSDK